jgi:GNAT superfamily N-acetyltransferase
VSDLTICQVPLAHPDARYLIERVQRIYVERYGGPDSDPLDPAEFAAPLGGFSVGYLDGRPVASGAWRRSNHPALGAERTAEVKRMYVVEEAQRLGIARRVLGHLEAEVAGAGIAVLILGTGSRQPEALALYRQAGYVPVPGFGHYADSPQAHFLGKRLCDEAAGRPRS